MSKENRNTRERINESSGAQSAKRRINDRLNSYLDHHKQSCSMSFSRLLSNPAQTLLTSVAVAIALALPALLMLLLSNVQSLGQAWDTEPKISLYLNARAKPAVIEKWIQELEYDSRVGKVRFISAEQALSEFEQYGGFGGALSGLGKNPLPASIEIVPVEASQSPDAQRQMADEWLKAALVDEVDLDLQWVQRFLALTELGRQFVFLLAGLLAFGAVLIIGNTVRLIIENRKDEIIIIKLVGGTNGFVSRPLLYSGGLYGSFGGLGACVLIVVALLLLNGPVTRLVQSYQSEFHIQYLSFLHAFGIIVCGTVLGWFGAVIAVGRHLSAIKPR